MNKLIKEEINRIREVMGLKLLNEAIVPAGSLKKLLGELLGSKFDEALNTIGQAASEADKTNATLDFIRSLRTSSDETVKNFVKSVEEAAIEGYDGFSSKLIDDLINGRLSDEVEEDILAKMAAKSVGIDDKLIKYLPSDINQLYTLIKQPVSTYTNKPIDGLVNSFKLNQEAFNEAVSLNSKITEIINGLPPSKFKSELSKSWENEVKYFDDVVKKMKGGADEAGETAAKQTEEVTNEVEKVRFTQEDIDAVMGVAETTNPLQGELANYMSKKFKVLGFDSWKRFSVEEQNKIILEMSSQINTAFEKKIKELGWDSGLVAANKMIQQTKVGALSPKVMEKVFRDTIAKSKPSFGPLGNALNGLVEYVSGVSARQGKIFWTTTGGWSEITKRWILFNLGLAVAEGTYRFYTTREEPTAEGVLNIVEQRVDFLGLAQRVLLPLPLISRIFVSELVQYFISAGVLNYDGFRQLTEAQISEEFGDTNVEVLDVNQFPCYDTLADKLKGFSKRANYFKVNGQNKGIWALNLSSGEVVQIQTPMSDDCTTPLVSGTKTPPPPPPVPNVTYTDDVPGFTKWYANRGENFKTITQGNEWNPGKDGKGYYVKPDGKKRFKFIDGSVGFEPTTDAF